MRKDEAMGRIVTLLSLPCFGADYLTTLADGLQDQVDQGAFWRPQADEQDPPRLRLCRSLDGVVEAGGDNGTTEQRT